MTIEIEAKIRLEKEEMGEIIKALGVPKFYQQDNSIYQRNNGYLRIRTENKEGKLTFKGKRSLDERLNCREEIELDLSLSDAAKMKEVLSAMGLKETLHYTKLRADYRSGGCAVSLDILPNGQSYIEIEGEEDKVEETLIFFNLQRKNLEKRSYHEILKSEKRSK